MLGGDQDDVAAAAAIAAAGTAARDELLPAEGEAAVAAVAGFYRILDFVDEQHRKSRRPARADRRPLGNRDGRLLGRPVMLTNLPMRPRSRNSTTPVTLANRVSSLPQPTFRPGLILVPRCRTMMRAARNQLAAENLHAQPLRIGIAPVFGTA